MAATKERRREIELAAKQRGTEAGPHRCSIPGCRANGRMSAIFELSEAVELLGPPTTNPISPTETESYIHRLEPHAKKRLVVLRMPKSESSSALMPSGTPPGVDVFVPTGQN